MPSIKRMKDNPDLCGLSRLHTDVTFAHLEGIELKCHILQPWNEQPDKRYPAIVFLQGSGWTFPDRGYELPQLAWYANHGYVIMTITHRNCMEGHPYPAFLKDAKTAIRFLRANADKYHVDPARVAFWGTSSGGNTSMLVQLTGDDPAFKTEEYADQSDSVKCCVECFGPSDMLLRVGSENDSDLFRSLMPGENWRELARGMSPYHRVADGKAYPPILMLHGDADPVVDYQTHGVRMYERYVQAGVDAQLICIENAPHEGPFWSQAVHDEILHYLDTHL